MVNQANGRTVQAADRRRNQKTTANPEPAAGGKLTAAAKISRKISGNFRRRTCAQNGQFSSGSAAGWRPPTKH
jgi:hypothetical protein